MRPFQTLLLSTLRAYIKKKNYYKNEGDPIHGVAISPIILPRPSLLFYFRPSGATDRYSPEVKTG